MQFSIPLRLIAVACAVAEWGIVGVTAAENNKLLIIMLDGLRWNYLENFFKPEDLSGFKKIQENGVRAESLKSDFPTLSYVNYYSLMTGLHPETHGFIHNYMYDPPTGKRFLIGQNEDQYDAFWWKDGEPLWVTAEKQGKRSFFWYWGGCEVEIRGIRPQFCQPYMSSPNPSFENLTKAFDSAIEVLRNGSADVAGVYFEQVDSLGHKYGPKSGNVSMTIRRIDAELNRILSALERKTFLAGGKRMIEGVNVMIFSDHGMTQLVDPVEGIININRTLFSPTDVVIGSKFGPVLQIYTDKENENKLYEALRNFHPNVTVYLKKEIPDRFFLKRHPRVPPLLLVADEGYAIGYQENATNTIIGFHGYDNECTDMLGIFFAIGPDFQRGKRTKALRVVDLYQVMCHVLNITPSANNGSWNDVIEMLTSRSMTLHPHATFMMQFVITAMAILRPAIGTIF